LLTSWGPDEFYGRGANRAIAFDPEPSTWEGWQSNPDPLGDIIPEDERDVVVERLAYLNRNAETLGFGFREILLHIQSQRRWNAVRFEVLLIEQFTNTSIPFDSPMYAAVAEHFVRQLYDYRSHRWSVDMLSALNLASSSIDNPLASTPATVTTSIAPPPVAKPLNSAKVGLG
jgi:hypothetical protein